ELYRCKSMIISKNIVNNNSRGIKLRYCKNNTISNNTANNNTGDGIFFSQSKGNTIKNNTIKSNRHNGIYFVGRSDNNTIFKNNVKDNEQNGIFFWAGDHNVIKENSIINNGRGIFLYDSDNNLVYYNCFNNTTNARDRINSLDEVHNHWDNGTVGNHWADYTGLDLDDNGIGDDPYTIAGYAGSQDNFPLMKCPFSAQDVVKEYKLMLINKGETQKWLNPLDFTYFS
ncbi:MAG: nitrous oxide reductase family maturation protein NosD, partial [Promethearchaeota archaeon]